MEKSPCVTVCSLTKRNGNKKADAAAVYVLNEFAA